MKKGGGASGRKLVGENYIFDRFFGSGKKGYRLSPQVVSCATNPERVVEGKK